MKDDNNNKDIDTSYTTIPVTVEKNLHFLLYVFDIKSPYTHTHTLTTELSRYLM